MVIPVIINFFFSEKYDEEKDVNLVREDDGVRLVNYPVYISVRGMVLQSG